MSIIKIIKSWKFWVVLLFVWWLSGKIKEEYFMPIYPGAMLTYQNFDEDIAIWAEYAVSPTGEKTTFTSVIKEGGATETLNVGNETKGLPEWVEYYWRDASRTDFLSTDDDSLPRIKKLPIKHQRVTIASRIPQHIIDRAIKAKKETRRGDLPKEYIWIYLTWYKGHIYFSWRLHDSTNRLDNEPRGGDTCKDGRFIGGDPLPCL